MTDDLQKPWYKLLNRYHWFVLLVCALGWLFDCLDQQLFVLARAPAMKGLLGTTDSEQIQKYGGYATSTFLMGWAAGGLFFGVLGDRIGRAKTMLITILMYSLCTGLSALSYSVYDFALYRFLTGLGVGGEFAVGVALVAEVMPERARASALGLLQALSAVGNVTAALINIGMGQLTQLQVIESGSAWRYMFVIGSVPALLALVIRRRLKEPERWEATKDKATTKSLGSYSELFSDPRWRKNAFIGLALAFAGVVGLWGIAFYSPELVRSVLTEKFKADGITGADLESKLLIWTGITSIVQNIGGFLGVYAFSIVTQKIGRRPTFALAFLAAMLSTAGVFWKLNHFSQIFWMIPIMGFCQLSVFGGYAIYFPELFPTRLRSTGTSFCYNVGRFVAAVGPPMLAWLRNAIYQDHFGFTGSEPLRYAGMTMTLVFVLGLLALPFAPETRGKPLPE